MKFEVFFKSCNFKGQIYFIFMQFNYILAYKAKRNVWSLIDYSLTRIGKIGGINFSFAGKHKVHIIKAAIVFLLLIKFFLNQDFIVFYCFLIVDKVFLNQDSTYQQLF